MEPILLQQLDFNGKEVYELNWNQKQDEKSMEWKIRVMKKDEQLKFRRDELYSYSLIFKVECSLVVVKQNYEEMMITFLCMFIGVIMSRKTK